MKDETKIRLCLFSDPLIVEQQAENKTFKSGGGACDQRAFHDLVDDVRVRFGSERSRQASAAFLLEPLFLASAFLEPLGWAAEAFVSEPTAWAGLSGPSMSSCSAQHSCPVGGQGRSAPSW